MNHARLIIPAYGVSWMSARPSPTLQPPCIIEGCKKNSMKHIDFCRSHSGECSCGKRIRPVSKRCVACAAKITSENKRGKTMPQNKNIYRGGTKRTHREMLTDTIECYRASLALGRHTELCKAAITRLSKQLKELNNVRT